MVARAPRTASLASRRIHLNTKERVKVKAKKKIFFTHCTARLRVRGL
jgi:hypothetical protein